MFGQFLAKKFIELLRKGTAEDRDSAIACLRTAFAPCALDAYPVRFNCLLHFSIFGIQLIAITHTVIFSPYFFIDGLVIIFRFYQFTSHEQFFFFFLVFVLIFYFSC